jgi:hypothetical protein
VVRNWSAYREWIRVCRQSPLLVWDATRSHPDFRYPAPPATDLGSTDLFRDMRDLACPEKPQTVLLAANLKQLMLQCLAPRKERGSKVGVTSPGSDDVLEALDELHFDVEFLPTDPDLIESTFLESLDGLIWSQPNRVDGSYFPPELYQTICDRYLKANPSGWLISEESASLFTLSQIPPGTAEPLALHDPRVEVVRSLEPVLAPHGTQMAYLYGGPEKTQSIPPLVSLDELRFSLGTLTLLRVRQGGRFAEFQRKILLMDKSLRVFGDALQKLLPKVRVAVWPQAGFSVCVRVPGYDCVQVAERLFEASGILAKPGFYSGLPESLIFCYAATPKFLEIQGERLVKAFPGLL